jgi:hypothetical protein
MDVLEIGRNRQLQGLIRETNELLHRLVERGDGTTVRLLCECGRCTGRLEIAASDYRRAREADGLLVKRGHEHVGRVVWQVDSFSLVEPGTAA